MKVICLGSVDSTQTFAKRHLHEFDSSEITLITAEEQIAGRGRFNRRWVSPKGVNFYGTFVFALPSHSIHLTSLAHVMTASLAQLLIEKGLSPKIKWPNDLLLSGKKAAGVLCETSFVKDLVHVFLGIGINVNMDQEALSQIDQPAVSLKIESGYEWSIPLLQDQLANRFIDNLALFQKNGFAPFHSLFEKLLAYKGEKVECFDGKTTWAGICHSITADGKLNIYLLDGSIHTISSGDLTFIKI